MRRPQNSRNRALELVDEGIISAEDLLTAALKYMSTDDVEDMLDCNELSDRFLNDEEDEECEVERREKGRCRRRERGRGRGEPYQ